jgi:hypothetical protein
MFARLTFAFILLLSVACGSSRAPSVAFDEQTAFGYLVAQCDLGPRVPNTEAHRKAIEMLLRHFQSLGMTALPSDFQVKDPYSKDTLHLTNVIARLNPQMRDRLLFCAHWDSRPRCEMDPDPAKRDFPLPGANDGASGVAVLMQLAKHLVESKSERGVDLVFFDGEDWGKSGDLNYYCLGSQEFARTVDASLYDYAILLDMVGDRDQCFYQEEYSVRYHPELVKKVWRRAGELGFAAQFPAKMTSATYDDHVPLLAASIRALDIIDFDYPWWHTSGDTPDKCSPESLGRVGKLLLSLVLSPL